MEEVADEWTPEGLEDDGSLIGKGSPELQSSEFRVEDSEDEKFEEEEQKSVNDDVDLLGEVHGAHELHGEGDNRFMNVGGPEVPFEVGRIPEDMAANNSCGSSSGGAPSVSVKRSNVKVKSKKPFNLLKDSHPRKPIVPSLVSDSRPKKRSRRDVEEPEFFSWPVGLVNVGSKGDPLKSSLELSPRRANHPEEKENNEELVPNCEEPLIEAG
ncbi:hypothetical protein Hanom_Chr06g00502081 [Helianthus anomalus]